MLVQNAPGGMTEGDRFVELSSGRTGCKCGRRTNFMLHLTPPESKHFRSCVMEIKRLVVLILRYQSKDLGKSPHAFRSFNCLLDNKGCGHRWCKLRATRTRKQAILLLDSFPDATCVLLN